MEQAHRHPGSRCRLCQYTKPGSHWHRGCAHRHPGMWRMLHGWGIRRPAHTRGHAPRCESCRSSRAGATERGGARRPAGLSHWLSWLSAGRSDGPGPGLARQGAAGCGRRHRAAPYRTELNCTVPCRAELYRTVLHRTAPDRAGRAGPSRAAPCREQSGGAARRMRWRRHCR